MQDRVIQYSNIPEFNLILISFTSVHISLFHPLVCLSCSLCIILQSIFLMSGFCDGGNLISLWWHSMEMEVNSLGELFMLVSTYIKNICF